MFERLCKGKVDKQLDVFYDQVTTQEDIQVAGIENFQYIYRSLGTPLPTIRFHRFSRQAKVGVIRPESLPATNSAAVFHSLRAYLQVQDWLVLKSMSRDPTLYGWSLRARSYEPVRTRLQSPWPRLTYSSLLAATAPEIVLHSDAPVGKIMSGASQFVGTAMAHHAKTTLIQIQAV